MVLSSLWAASVESELRPGVDEAVGDLEAAMAAAPQAKLSPGEIGGLPDRWQTELADVVAEAGPSDPALSQAVAVLERRVHELPTWRFGWVASRPTALGWLTYLFIHTELFHLLANLVLFWFLGASLEVRLGPERLSAVFLASGAAGAWVHLGVHGAATVPMIGASAAVAGVLGALIVWRPPAKLAFVFLSSKGPRAARAVVTIPLAALVLIWVSLEVLAFVEPSAAPSALPAHLGGLAMGLALGRGLRR